MNNTMNNTKNNTKQKNIKNKNANDKTVKYEIAKEKLEKSPRTFLLTGGAGFIGSNILETLLLLNQKVIVIDDLSTGYQENIDDVLNLVGKKAKNCVFIKGDIRDYDLIKDTLKKKVSAVIHQAAIGSVPRSLDEPQYSEAVNVGGFVNILKAMSESNVKRIVFASSSSVYGDNQDEYKKEEKIGKLLSPYALTKYADELYADLYARLYGVEYVGLRYFNVFGKRQNPKGAYAAVIPLWVDSILNGKKCTINGDGSTSRDFCYVKNVIQANILGATLEDKNALNNIYNIAFGKRTTLKELYKMIVSSLEALGFNNLDKEPLYKPFRKGDILHSLADISKSKALLGYAPKYSIQDGMEEYLSNFKKA
ncbi:MAG: NAD-dependent epimerase/dehydratase family protein [Bdellovibrionota bacterium]